MKINFRDPTIISLVLVNLITITMAVWFSWNLLDLLWAYWWQSIIIGFFSFLKILLLKDFSSKGFTFSAYAGTKANKKEIKLPKGKINVFVAFFFAFHYGIFHIVYAFFLANLPFEISANFSYVAFAALLFFINHLFSFLYYMKMPKKRENIGTVMFAPYKRIVPMHFTLLLGGFLYSVLLLGAVSRILLVVFLFIKTATDLAAHSMEHAPAANGANKPHSKA